MIRLTATIAFFIHFLQPAHAADVKIERGTVSFAPSDDQKICARALPA